MQSIQIWVALKQVPVPIMLTKLQRDCTSRSSYLVLLQYLWESSLQWLFPAHIKHIFTWLWTSGMCLNGNNVKQGSPGWQMVSTEIFTLGSAILKHVFQMNTQSRLISLLFRLAMPSLKNQQSPGAEFRWGEWFASVLEIKEHWSDGQDFPSAFHCQV